MKHAVLDFSLRIAANISVEEMRTRIENAIGCKLVEGDYHGTAVFKTQLLGMQILFSEWRGIDGTPVFQLHGLVDDPKFLEGSGDPPEVVGIDINRAIIDLLALRGAGDWHVPSRAEIEAEIEYAERKRLEFLTPGTEH